MPSEELHLAEEHGGKVHLLLTDVVMPLMTGRDLATRLESLDPDLKTLFMSGDTAEVIARRDVGKDAKHPHATTFSLKSE